MRSLFLLGLLLMTLSAFAGEPGSVPIIYTTDLYHPHCDPDDHYDLATLFALPEFDIRAIVIDQGAEWQGKAAVGALQQMMHLTGRTVPYAVGLVGNLEAPGDTATDRPEVEQAGVALLLKTLRAADEPVTLFTTGSLRDVAAAFNRAPAIFEEKVARLYVNAGAMNDDLEWNVGLDHHAFVRMLKSGLPVYFCPCFGDDGYGTYWKFTQGDVLDDLAPALQQYFLYMLEKAGPDAGDPVEFLERTPDPEAKARHWPQPRNMWCTAPFLHAAGRDMPASEFVARAITVGPDGRTALAPEGDSGVNLHVFHVTAPESYPDAMRATLETLFGMLL